MPIKRHRVAEWIRKQDPYICCLQETHLRSKDTCRLEGKGWEKIFYTNGNKNSWSSNHISDKIDFKTKATIRKRAPHKDK